MQTKLLGRPAVLAAIFALFPAGCSFAFVDGPPTTHKQLPYFDCTSSKVLPTVDAVIGGAYGIGAVASLAGSSSSGTYSSSNDRSDTILAGATAILFVASAVYGYQKTSSCREAKEQLMLRMGNGPGFAPGPAPPPVDPWLNPPPSSFGAPPPAPPSAPTPTGPAQDNEVPRP